MPGSKYDSVPRDGCGGVPLSEYGGLPVGETACPWTSTIACL